jgi:hypothetical protein
MFVPPATNLIRDAFDGNLLLAEGLVQTWDIAKIVDGR